MNASFIVKVNTKTPKLKNPHFVVDHNVNMLKISFLVLLHVVFIGKSRSGKPSHKNSVTSRCV